MPAVAEDITAVERVEIEISNRTQAPIITTLYDLIAALNEQVEAWEDDVVTAAVVHLCNVGRLRFLGVPGDCQVVYA